LTGFGEPSFDLLSASLISFTALFSAGLLSDAALALELALSVVSTATD